MTPSPLRRGSDPALPPQGRHAKHGDGLVQDSHLLPRGIRPIIAHSPRKVKGIPSLCKKNRPSPPVLFQT